MFGRKALKYATAMDSLVLDVDETVTCFCRKARRKEKEVCSAPGPEEPKLYLEEAVLQERKLPDVDLSLLVDLPAGLDYNEWLASHTIAFFDHINLVYGTISEFCTMSGCPDMTGPGLRTYLWFDEKGKKTKVAAPQYIDYVMTFTQKTISDESIFPTKYANDFPSSFESIVKKILRLLFHVTAHLYHCHFREILLLNLHAHLNCVFAHFSLFDERFSLVDPKETEILRDLVVALRLHSSSSHPPPPFPLPPRQPLPLHRHGRQQRPAAAGSTRKSSSPSCNSPLSLGHAAALSLHAGQTKPPSPLFASTRPLLPAVPLRVSTQERVGVLFVATAVVCGGHASKQGLFGVGIRWLLNRLRGF